MSRETVGNSNAIVFQSQKSSAAGEDEKNGGNCNAVSSAPRVSSSFEPKAKGNSAIEMRDFNS